MSRKLTGPKICKGQVWRRLSLIKGRKAEVHDILITRGGDRPKGKRIDKPHIQHHFKPKSLWLFYELIGTEKNYPPLLPAAVSSPIRPAAPLPQMSPSVDPRVSA